VYRCKFDITMNLDDKRHEHNFTCMCNRLRSERSNTLASADEQRNSNNNKVDVRFNLENLVIHLIHVKFIDPLVAHRHLKSFCGRS
jgi:hypothetical protein